MTLGPQLLLKCTGCGRHVIRHTLQSGNTFGAELWTDGRLVAPMMPRRMLLPYWYCRSCHRFQEVAEMTESDRREPRAGARAAQKMDKRWQEAEDMAEPEWQEYLEGISQWEKRLGPRPDLETELRMRAWRRYNDGFREKDEGPHSGKKGGTEVPRIPEMMENCNDVASWLYEGNPDKAMDKADILRWLGRYELAVQLLYLLPDLPDFARSHHLPRHRELLQRSRNRDSALAIVSDQE